MNNPLHLVLKGIYYDMIDCGDKTVEYRDYTHYWRKRVIERQHETVIFHRGYTNVTMEFEIKEVKVVKESIEIHLGKRRT